MRALRGPETSRIAETGLPHYGQPRPDEKTRAILESWGAYTGRVSPSAGPTRTRYPLWPADGLTPELIIGAQREAVTGGIPLRWVELIDQIYSRDGHYASTTNQRVGDVIKGSHRLVRAQADDAGTAVRNFVHEAYSQISRWTDGLGWLLFSNLYSYSAVEVEWHETQIWFPGPRGETIGPVDVALPRQFHNVHPKHFRFDLESDDPLFWLGNAYQPLPLGKFIFLDGDGLHPIKVRRGHAWQCVWYSLFRSIGWASWAVHVERFGLPVPVIQYEGDVAQYDEYKAAYEDVLNSLGQGKGVIVPRTGAQFDIKDPPAGGRSSDPASALSDACDAGQSIRVLGATLTNKIGNVGSFAASSTHAEAKYALEEGDARRMWERVDEQLTRPLVRFNAVALADALRVAGYDMPPALLCRRVPRGKHRVPREVDPQTEAAIAATYINDVGLPISMEALFDKIDLTRASSDEDRAPGRSESVSKGGALIPVAEAAASGGAENPDEAAEMKARADVARAENESEPGGDAPST